MSDHDLIIRLDAKMDQLSIDVKNLSDGTATKIANIELRVVALEKTATEYDTSKYVKMTTDNSQWIHDFQGKWKFIVTLAVGFGSIVTFILIVILNTLNILHFR